MKRFKKTLRLFSLGLLIVLASFGLGLSGAVPVMPNNKREDRNEVRTELVETKKKDDTDTEEKDVE